MSRTRNPWLGPAARPVAIPEDIDDPSVVKASGVVELPFHVDVGELVELFEELVLPPTLRRAWADWLLRHRGVVLAC